LTTILLCYEPDKSRDNARDYQILTCCEQMIDPFPINTVVWFSLHLIWPVFEGWRELHVLVLEKMFGIWLPSNLKILTKNNSI